MAVTAVTAVVLTAAVVTAAVVAAAEARESMNYFRVGWEKYEGGGEVTEKRM